MISRHPKLVIDNILPFLVQCIHPVVHTVTSPSEAVTVVILLRMVTASSNRVLSADTSLCALRKLFHMFLTITLRDRFYFWPHFLIRKLRHRGVICLSSQQRINDKSQEPNASAWL